MSGAPNGPPNGMPSGPPDARVAVAADFALDDQFGRGHAVRFADAPLTALVFSGRATAEDGAAWGRALAGALAAAGVAGARIVAVAAVGPVPGFARGLVRALLAGRAAVPVDWNDEVAARFGYRAGAALVVLVDDAGRVCGAAEGPPTPRAVAELAAAGAAGR